METLPICKKYNDRSWPVSLKTISSGLKETSLSLKVKPIKRSRVNSLHITGELTSIAPFTNIVTSSVRESLNSEQIFFRFVGY